MIELTTSPTVSAVCFFSEFCLRMISHQSTRKITTLSTLMPQQTPTYLQRNFKSCMLSFLTIFPTDSLVSEHLYVV